MSDVQEYIEDGVQRFTDEIFEFLRIPSVSARSDHDADTRRAAEWLQAKLIDVGLEAEVINTPGHPIVLAEWRGAGEEPLRSSSTVTTTCSLPSPWSSGILHRSSRSSAKAVSTPAAPPTTRGNFIFT